MVDENKRFVNFSKGEKIIERVLLEHITVSHNPRKPAPKLQDSLAELGYPNLTILQFCHQLALGNETDKRNFVELIEKFEKEPRGIVELAESRKSHETEPVRLRTYSVKDNVRFGIIAGERRIIAHFYLHAKYNHPAHIGAVKEKITKEEADIIAFEENFCRKDMTDCEVGRWFHKQMELRKKKDPRYSLSKFAEDIKKEYQFVRSREALAYLPQDIQDKVDSKILNTTDAVNMGLKIKRKQKNGEEDKEEEVVNNEEVVVKEKATTRKRTKSYKELQQLFDTERAKDSEEEIMNAYLKGLADAMNCSSLEEAIKESDERIKNNSAE